VASGDGDQEDGALVEADSVNKRSDKILNQNIIAALSDRTALRIDAETGTNARLVDVISTDPTILERFDNFEAFGRRDGADMSTQ
jgi:hypothetical protein